MDKSETASRVRSIGTIIFGLSVLTGFAAMIANLFEADLPGVCLVFGWLAPFLLGISLWLVAWLMDRSAKDQP